MKEYDVQKSPPHAKEIEEDVLGTAIMFPESREEFLDLCEEQVFYIPKNRRIFQAIENLHENDHPVDIKTVEQWLSDRDYDSSGVVEISQGGNPGRLRYMCQILTEKYLLREAAYRSANITSKAYQNDVDPYELIDEINSQLIELDGGSASRKSVTPSEIFYRESNTLAAEKLVMGLKTLDELVYTNSGNRKGHLEVIIGESGHGKTTYAKMKAEHLARNGYKILWFQLEGHDVHTAEHFSHNIPEHQDNVWICTNTRDIEAIKREMRIMRREVGIEAVFIDYVQNMECAKQTRSDAVEYMSKQLEHATRDLNVCMNVLSQVTINYGNRTGWQVEPKYNDVRWSQQIKQDADIMVSIFRPSLIDSLVKYQDGHNYVEDWDGNLQPENSVFVRKVKDRYGANRPVRVHHIHTDNGLRLYSPIEEPTFVNGDYQPKF